MQQLIPTELWQWVHHSYGDELGLTSSDDDYVHPRAPASCDVSYNGVATYRVTSDDDAGVQLQCQQEVTSHAAVERIASAVSVDVMSSVSVVSSPSSLLQSLINLIASVRKCHGQTPTVKTLLTSGVLSFLVLILN